VNGRPVRDRALNVTIAQAYGSVLERGRYPRGVVYLDLPPELVDVNVHPQKSEVRFADPRAVGDAVYSVLGRALSGAFSLPTPDRGAWNKRPAQAPEPAAAGPRGFDLTPRQSAAVAPELAAVQPAQGRSGSELLLGAMAAGISDPDAPALAERAVIAVRDSSISARIEPSPAVRWSSLNFVAQLRHTFLVCEGDEGLYLLDQHAAAERVTFTRLRRAYQSRAVASQALLFPLMLEVTGAEAELVEQHVKEFAEVGLDVRVRGPESVSVHTVPKLLMRASAERLLRDLLSEVSKSGGRGFSNAVDLALATMACHGSVRAGDVLSASEAKALLVSLDEADFAGHCPHGRPVVTFLSWAELERKVGRR
jgi:DNA mismatch repair protein MutL